MTDWHSDFFEIDLDSVQEPNVNSWGAKGSLDDMKEWMLCVKEIQKLCRERGASQFGTKYKYSREK